MEIYRTPSKEIQEIILANVTYEAVIDGLNGYFTSEPRNEYITIKMEPDKQNFALYEAEAWADILIEWLRKKHDIFYRPGSKLDQVEAARSAAKMCRLRAHIKDEICKRGLWFGADEDIPELVDTLFKAYDEEGKRADKNRNDVVKLSRENGELRKEVKDIMNDIRQKSSRNGFEFPEEIDGEPLTVKRVFHDLLELLRMKETRIRNAERETRKAVSEECYDYLWNALKKLSPDCDALKITDYEDLVDRIFYEMSLVNDNCKKCRRKQSTEKFSYIQRTNKAEEEVKKLKEQLDKAAADYQALSEENQKHKDSVFDLEKTCYRESYISDRIHEICAAKGVELDDTFLYNDDYTWEDLVVFLCEEIGKLKKEIKEVTDQRWKDLRDINKTLGYDGMDGHVDDFAKAVKARAECVKRALGEESDINTLIRDYCTKNNIVAPSRYFSEKACVEYLFSVIDLKQKDRSFTILQDLYRDIFKRQPDGLSAEDIANKILDRVLKTEDLLHKSVDSVNKECKATGRLMVDDYKLKLKSYILKDIKEHGYRYDGLQSKSIEEIVDWIIVMATCDRSNIALRDIYTTVVSPVERRRYNIDDCDGPTVDHMKDYILRRFEGLHANNEYCLKKMSELDEYKKHFETLKEKQEFLSKQNMEFSCKISAKDDEISRLKDLINAMNEEVKDI